VDSAGAKLSPGSPDPHWSVISGPGIGTPTAAIAVANQNPLGLYFERSDSNWIWSNASASAVVGAPYVFELSIDLSGFDPSTATLAGFWGVDNTGRISLNGSIPVGTGTFELSQVSIATFSTGYGFTITGGFVSGFNRLSFEVTDAGNPAALNVYGLSATATPVPELSSSTLLFLGLAALVFAPRRRSPSAA
jgi:hypothetical protein